MVQRGLLNLRQGIFRISAPGVDVKTAALNQLLLDERVLYPQILQSFYVPNTGGTPVTVPIINYGFVPEVYAYGRYAGEDNRAYPAAAIYRTNQSQNHFFYSVSATQLVVNFPSPSAVMGAQLITMRP